MFIISYHNQISYYMKSNGFNPLLVACSTFCNGAVEQFNVHTKCLNVPFYQKEYTKDPFSVATEIFKIEKTDDHLICPYRYSGGNAKKYSTYKRTLQARVRTQPRFFYFFFKFWWELLTDTLNFLTGSLDQATSEEKKYIIANTGNVE